MGKALYNPYAGIEGYLEGFPAPEVGDSADYGKGYVSGWGGLPGDLGRALRNVQILSPNEPLLPSSEDIGKALGADIESEEFFAGTLGLPGIDDAVMKALMLWGGIGAGAATFNKALGRAGPLNYEEGMVAFHGTPHKFDVFDLSKIGTGEGAQAYGHGLYFAENPGVAQTYATTLARNSPWDQGKEYRIVNLGDKWEISSSSKNRGVGHTGSEEWGSFLDAEFDTPDEAFDFLKKEGLIPENAIKDVEEYAGDVQQITTYSRGPHLYEVDIPDETIDKMLDWDAPLSEQPDVLKVFRESTISPFGRKSRGWRGATDEMWENATKTWTGQQIYRDLAEGAATTVDELPPDLGVIGEAMRRYNIPGDIAPGERVASLAGRVRQQLPSDAPAEVVSAIDTLIADDPQTITSRLLNEAGIPGIRYYDGASRSAKDGTRNIVVFDPNDIKSVKRDGELVYKQ